MTLTKNDSVFGDEEQQKTNNFYNFKRKLEFAASHLELCRQYLTEYGGVDDKINSILEQLAEIKFED